MFRRLLPRKHNDRQGKQCRLAVNRRGQGIAVPAAHTFQPSEKPSLALAGRLPIVLSRDLLLIQNQRAAVCRFLVEVCPRAAASNTIGGIAV